MDGVKKLVFLDIDGTLYSKGCVMSRRVKDALRQAGDNGHLLCICSGRAYCQIPGEMRTFDGVVSAAGACIMWKGEVLLAEYLSGEEMERIAGLLEETGTSYIMEGFDNLYMKKDDRERILKKMESLPPERRGERHFFEAPVPCNCLAEMEKVHKCAYFYAEREGGWFREKLKRWNMSVTAFSQSGSMGNSGEITKTAFNKGTAIRYLSGYLGIAVRDTIAIGDSENDLEMLGAAGVGIAMGNSSDAVKRAADDVTGSVEEDGVYHAFLKYGLIV